MEIVRRLVVAILLLAFFHACPAQAGKLAATIGHDSNDAVKVAWRMIRAPFRGDTEDYFIAGGLIAAVAVSSAMDRSMRKEMKDRPEGWAVSISDIGYNFSLTRTTYIASASLYGLGLISDNENVRRTGLEVSESFLLASIGSQILKHSLGRNRPHLENGPYHFSGPNLKDEKQSFPSGNTVTAFSLAAVLSAEAKSVPVSVLFYSLAGATAFQRMHRDRHWFSDTLGGAMLGTAVGLGVVHYHRQLLGKTTGFSVSPDKNGCRLNIEW
ncbi:phosphatase PAP2 family protein [candidate division KSB1 bacterium]|nr:MAG: phosphatase PAP2 family protein [candidate division KSB1 bacterium]